MVKQILSHQEVSEWYELSGKIPTTLSNSDYQELIRLNHLVMEASHEIHNNNMLKGRGE